MRRATQEALTKKRVTEFYPVHEKEALVMVDSMLRNPLGYEAELRR